MKQIINILLLILSLPTSYLVVGSILYKYFYVNTPDVGSNEIYYYTVIFVPFISIYFFIQENKGFKYYGLFLFISFIFILIIFITSFN